MGMDRDLNIAMKEAVSETINFLKAEKGMTPGRIRLCPC
jgi:acetamidase/formamidase